MNENRFVIDSIDHDEYLQREQHRLVGFFERGLANGQFLWLGIDGAPDTSRPLALYAVARLVHCFSVEHLLGREGAKALAQRALDHLREDFSDERFGGFLPEARGSEATSKDLYGHAFVLLAGSSALRAGLDGAVEVFENVNRAIDEHFWVEAQGAAVEAWDRSFTICDSYRGQNGNMHLTEAYLAAFDATGKTVFLDRAELLAQRFVRDAAPAFGWRVPEHYTEQWTVDAHYNDDKPDDPFRPAGTLPGHALEWARLVLGLRAVRPSASWARDAAEALFSAAVADAWADEPGGFAYTVDFEGKVINPARMHWTAAEGVGAALALYRATGERTYSEWYSRIWRYIESHVIDRVGGSWWHELGPDNEPSLVTWGGKPDLYHAWQATLYARVQGELSIADAAARGAVRLAS